MKDKEEIFVPISNIENNPDFGGLIISDNDEKQKYEAFAAAFKSLDKKTREFYIADIKQFQQFANKQVFDATPADIVNYINFLKAYISPITGNKYSNATIQRKVTAISTLFNKAIILGIKKENPVKILKTINSKLVPTIEYTNPEIPFDYEEISNIIKSIENEKIRIVLYTLIQTGLRISELANIERKNIKLEKNYVIIKIKGKYSKYREVYLNRKTYEQILTIFGTDSDYLFPNPKGKPYTRQMYWLWIKTEFEKDGLKAYPHLMRHFFVTQKIHKEKRDIKAVSKYVGHSRVSTTLDMYVDSKLTPEEALNIMK